MNVRDLILTNDQLANTETETGATTKRKRSKPSIEWSVVMTDACDGAIRRKTSKTSRLLVLLLSQGQFYIKDEVSGDVEQLDPTNLAKFLAGSPELSAVPWCRFMGGGSKTHAAEFVRIANDENFQWMAKRGLHSFTYSSSDYDNSRFSLSDKRRQLDSPLSRLISRLGDEVLGHERWTEVLGGSACESEAERKLKWLNDRTSVSAMNLINERFGIDVTRDFVRAYVNAPYVGTRLPSEWRLRQLLDVCEFDHASLREYLFYESVRQGFGTVDASRYDTRLDVFINTWVDTLRMQMTLRNRVYDKYPDDLPGLHQRLSFRCQLRQVMVDENGFRLHSERIAENERKRGGYLIRVPRNKEDMLDEAAQQANCLASYVNAYAEDRTDIYFMREVSKPEESLVTVEVRDGRVRQAYRACNRRPTDEELQWLNEWADEIGIVGPDIDHQHPMVA